MGLLEQGAAQPRGYALVGCVQQDALNLRPTVSSCNIAPKPRQLCALQTQKPLRDRKLVQSQRLTAPAVATAPCSFVKDELASIQLYVGQRLSQPLYSTYVLYSLIPPAGCTPAAVQSPPLIQTRLATQSSAGQHATRQAIV